MNASEAKFEIRRLDFGETTIPGTDFGVVENDVHIVRDPYVVTESQAYNKYRINCPEVHDLVSRVHELEKAIRELFVFSEMIDETLVIRIPYDVAKRVSGLVARP